jgi:hypothetical protein
MRVRARDDIAQMFIRRISACHQTAKQELQAIQARQRELSEELVAKLQACDWLRVSRTSEIVCKPRRCWILVRRSESARIRTFGWPKCREPSNGNGYRRV